MTDEKYVYVQDVREKKTTARSARHTRSHCGKGGAVKFPSDYLSKKELKAMNSDVTTYRLNDPLSWSEFKAMPDDIKIVYIKALRQKYGVPTINIAEMLGIHSASLRKELSRLNIAGKMGKPGQWDKEGFYAWVLGETTVSPEISDEPNLEENVPCEPIPDPDIKMPPVREKMAIPCSGSMTFEGQAEDVLKAVAVLLGGANVRISVTWEVCPEEGVREGG